MHPSANTIIDLYERHAQSWDEDRGRSLFERPWLDRFRAFVQQGGSLLDVGCGSGEPIAHYFVERGHPVTGVDASPSLIALCRTRFPHQTWTVCDMRAMDLGAEFDGIVAWDSFFHLDPAAQRSMFARFRQHAKPGAPLLFTSGPDSGEAIGSFNGEALYHASLSAAEYEALLAANGFEVLAHVVEDAACGGHTVWLARST